MQRANRMIDEVVKLISETVSANSQPKAKWMAEQ